MCNTSIPKMISCCFLFCRDSDIVLLLRKRSPAEEGYEQEEVFVWDTLPGSTARHLRSALASHLDCGVDQLHLASFVPDRLEWRLIMDCATVNNSRTGVCFYLLFYVIYIYITGCITLFAIQWVLLAPHEVL